MFLEVEMYLSVLGPYVEAVVLNVQGLRPGPVDSRPVVRFGT